MANNKFVEFMDPVDSFDFQSSRIPFLKPGRYHGFDTITEDTGDQTQHTFSLFHGTGEKGSIPQTGEDGVVKSLGTLVTRHGLIANSEIGSSNGISISVPINADSDQVMFHVIYAKYTWVSSEGGSEISYGAYPGDVAEDFQENSLDQYLADPTTEVPLGFIAVGAEDGVWKEDNLTLSPSHIPEFAWKEPLDLSSYARKDEANGWQITQSFGYKSLTNPLNTSTHTMTLDGTSNVYKIFQDTAGRLDTLEAPSILPGAIIRLSMASIPSFSINTDAIKGLPKNSIDGDGEEVFEVLMGDVLTLLYTGDNWIFLGVNPSRYKDPDFSGVAMLNNINLFKKAQSYRASSIGDNAVSPSGVLSLSPDDGSVFHITFTNSGLSLDSLSDGLSSLGGLYTLIFDNPLGAVITTKGNIFIYSRNSSGIFVRTSLPLYSNQSLTFYKDSDGNFTLVGAAPDPFLNNSSGDWGGFLNASPPSNVSSLHAVYKTVGDLGVVLHVEVTVGAPEASTFHLGDIPIKPSEPLYFPLAEITGSIPVPICHVDILGSVEMVLSSNVAGGSYSSSHILVIK